MVTYAETPATFASRSFERMESKGKDGRISMVLIQVVQMAFLIRYHLCKKDLVKRLLKRQQVRKLVSWKQTSAFDNYVDGFQRSRMDAESGIFLPQKGSLSPVTFQESQGLWTPINLFCSTTSPAPPSARTVTQSTMCIFKER